MAWDTTRKRKLREQLLHPLFVLRNIRIDLAINSLKVSVGHQTRSAVARPGDVDHVEIVFLYHSVQMSIDKIETWRGSPVSQQPGFDMLFGQGLLEERVIIKINLPDREIVRCAPVSIE